MNLSLRVRAKSCLIDTHSAETMPIKGVRLSPHWTARSERSESSMFHGECELIYMGGFMEGEVMESRASKEEFAARVEDDMK
jgi:hypothetical protein